MTTTPALTLADIDLLDGNRFVQGPPHDQWKLLRREAPVYWHPGLEAADGRPGIAGFWCITKYEDVLRVSREPNTFISGKGITAYIMDPELPLQPEFGGGTMMITTDPPRHVRMRRLVNKGFTPRMVAQLEPHIRGIVTRILDDVAPRGACDFVTDAAALLPLAVICDMMGVPQADWSYMFDLTNKVLGADDPEYQAENENSGETGEKARIDMFGYFSKLIAERTEQKDDLLGVLIGADIDGEKLSQIELLFFCFLLIVAGNETTRNATSGGLLALIDHPDQREKLRRNPDLLPSAVEEILRWTSPVLHMARVATADTEIRGQQIRENQKVVMWYPSANRDEDIFPDGDVFNIERSPNDHLAFGIGEHFCLGAGLARLELRVMFEELLRRLPDVEHNGPVERLRSSFIGGIKHMPVRYTATRA